MRNFKLYISLLLLMAFGLVGCQDDFAIPPIVVPEATKKANISILEIKKQFWNEAENYIDTIRTKADGSHYIIKGRVISSDATGNIYKNLVIQDETAALAMSINANSIYTTYRLGQEIVIDLTDMYIGKYANLQQLGFPDFSTQFGWQTTFMPLEFLKAHAELNGLPDVAAIDTLTTTIAALPTNPEGMQKWQSQLIRLDNVHFEYGGKETFAEADKTTSRTLIDENGNSIIVRNSNYATFKNDILPSGTGSVVAILSRFNKDWQLLLRSAADCIDFEGNKPGTKDNPYTVEKAIDIQGTGKSGWVTGFIVGAVKPEVTSVTSSADIEWKAPTTLGNTIVIGQTADTKDISKAIVITLGQGTALRAKANLADNPGVYQKKILITGSLAKVMGASGLINSGAVTEFEIEGQAPSQGDGTEANPFTVAQVMGTASGSGMWVTGYIVGWVEGMDIKVGAKFTVPATVASNILMAAEPGVTDLAQCIPVQLPFGDIRTALNLIDNSGNLGAKLNIQGSLEKYFGVPAVKAPTAFKLDGGGGVTPPVDPNPPVSNSLRADFETLNKGEATGYYITSESTNGWTIKNASILIGGAADANPIFAFIGKVPGTEAWAFAPNLNGKVGVQSSIVSPVITTGCGALTFNYAYAFSEANGIDFRVEIKQGGAIVKTIQIKDAAAVKGTQYTHTEALNIKGDFTMEFHPNSPSNITDSNKDRFCVYNVSWTENK